jgi:DNA-directed RNA polymerase specialized sigma24 family protein
MAKEFEKYYRCRRLAFHPNSLPLVVCFTPAARLTFSGPSATPMERPLMPEPNAGSVTAWVAALQNGESDAARKLWKRYFGSLLRVVTYQLGGSSCSVADEEDVTLNVFDSVCRRLANGKLADIDSRQDLWRVLLVLARQKSIDHRRTQSRQKRGGGTHVDSWVRNSAGESENVLDTVSGTGPSPDEIAAVREELAALLQCLSDETLRKIALGKLEGRTNEELAGEMGVTPRTVERKLALIRDLWLARKKSEAAASTVEHVSSR